MQLSNHNRVLLKYFLALPLSTALYRWIEFRLFCQQENTVERLNLSANQCTGEQILATWQASSTQQSSVQYWAMMLVMVSGLLGVSTMTGLLMVAAQHTVNIWLPLAVFAFIPLLLTLIAGYSSLLSNARFSLQQHLSLKILLPKAMAKNASEHQGLLLAWLFWQIQRMAVSFVIFALAAFAIFGVFQSFSFGWSSTFIKSSETFTELMQVISWPWHFWWPSPSMELIEATQLGQAHFNLQAAQNWWPTLVMAIVCYGLAPRVLLCVFLRRKFKQQLSYDIIHSSDLDQLINRINQQPSQNPQKVNEPTVPPLVVDLTANQWPIIAWQKGIENVDSVRVLGQADWQADEHWLHQYGSEHEHEQVMVAVHVNQTPTFELADSIKILAAKGKSVAILVTGEPTARFKTQLTSWQLFATQHRFNLLIEAQLYGQQ